MSPRLVRRSAMAVLLALVVAVLAGCGGSLVDAKTAAQARVGTEGGARPAQQDSADPGSTLPGTVVPTAPAGQAPGTETPGTTGPVGAADPVVPGPGGPPAAGDGPSPVPAAAAPTVSCAGFRNSPGMTDDVVRIGNASDISGPVPGLFKQAQNAVRAFVAYFNASGARICGRRLELDMYDSRTDAGADQSAAVKGCATDFAMVGSMSAFDSGGARTTEQCGIPDVRAIATTVERTACRTCFAAQPAGPSAFQNAVADYLLRHTSGKKAGMLYLGAGAAAANGPSQVRHETKRGVHFAAVKSVDVAEFNYAPYVQALKSAGAESVQFIGAAPQFVRLAQSMQQNSYTPKVFLLDPTAYSDEYTQPAGPAAKGTVVFLNFTPFEEAAGNPELALYLRYLQLVSPGAKPTFFGLFAWSAARLFAREATRLGGRLTRSTLLAAMSKVDNWTAYGVHAAQHVGSKKTADCWRFVQWSGSAWKPVDGTKYHCTGTDID